MENSSKSETVSEQDIVYNDDTDQSNINEKQPK